MFLCTLPNSKSIKFRLWGIRIKQSNNSDTGKLLHCHTVILLHFLQRFVVSYLRLTSSLFYRAFLSLLNLVVSLQRRLVRSAVAFQLFVVSPARHHRLQWYSLSVFMTFYNLQNSVKLTTLDLKIFPGHAPDPRRCRAFVALFVPPVFSPWCRHCMPLDQV